MDGYIIWPIVVAFCLPFFISNIRKKRWTRVVILGIPITIFVLVAYAFIYQTIMAKSPSWVYKKAFGEYPTNDISIVESNYRFGGDYIEVILKFKTNDLSKLLASHAELKPITQEKFEKQIYSPQLPSWFKPLEKLPSKFYMASPYGGEYGSSDALLSYNSESGLVFFRYSAVD